MTTDLDIASAATLLPIGEIAASLGLRAEDITPFGYDKAKIPATRVIADRDQAGAAGLGRLILVTAMSPTPAGEGKTTTSIGLADGLSRLAEEEGWHVPAGQAPAVLALREPSLGPVFGMMRFPPDRRGIDNEDRDAREAEEVRPGVP